jgi:type II secretion system protein D
LVWLACGVAGAGEPPGGATAEYQVYSLRHKSAADVEKLLTDMLAGMGSAVHVVADVKANQILVRGAENVQQSARQLIESIDAPPAGLAAEAKPTVKSYLCAEGRQSEVLSWLRSAYAQRSDVRAAIDPQTGALVVLAPPAVQAEIAPRIPAPDAVRRDFPPTAETGSSGQFVALIHVRAGDVETTLRELFRERLIPVAGPRPGDAQYQFAGPRGGRVALGFDRQRNGVSIHGSGPAAMQWVRLIQNLDVPPQTEDHSTQVVPLYHASPLKVQEAVEAYRNGSRGAEPRDGPRDTRPTPRPDQQGAGFERSGVEPVSYLSGRPLDGAGEARVADMASSAPAIAAPAPVSLPPAPAGLPPAPGAPPPAVEPRPAAPAEQGALRRIREMGLDVEIETLPELDAIIIRGRKRDVDEVKRIIQEIERLSTETEPAIDVYPLRYVEGQALAELIRQVQADVLTSRQGRVTILPLGKPNALLLIGWGEAVKKAKELIAKLDQPVDPQTQERVFPLRNAAATTVATTIGQFFATAAGLQPKVRATADPRTNALIIQAAPRDMAEVELLLEKLDSPDSASVFRTRIFKLYNTLATDVYATLQGAIDAARGGGAAGQRSAALELLAVDPRDPRRDRLLRSGILNDVRITPDPRLNILFVAAPPESMDLLAALVKELDSPGAVAQIKVFRIQNGDANSMVQMLRSLIPAPTGAGGPQLSVAEGEPSTMGLRFSTDLRTNSIIAIGSTGDLRIVEALILRLDALDVRQRKTEVYRLKNSPVNDVANAVNRFLTTERQVQLAAPGAFNPFQQLESEVVVVAEPVSNALIISATPRFYQEIHDLVEKLDAQPSQVMIQVLIAQVTLENTDEFGIELGLQDSVLFGRSAITGNLTPQTTSNQQTTPIGQIITNTNQSFPAATLSPGYDFNSPTLPNGTSANALQSANQIGSQALSSLGVGRTNSTLGYGGLVLSASSDSISALLRALQESQRLEVLSRPHIMTLDNQPAFIQIGQRVPRITGSMAPTLGAGQVFNTFELMNVGLILGVTPRISPEGKVVMEIDAERSSLEPESSGIPVSIAQGTVIRSPIIDTTMAQTTVSAADGETIVLGGLITKNDTKDERKVPLLGDIPVLGILFRYNLSQVQRTELLIVLTPHVVHTPEDMERIKRIESARMHWCLESVRQIHCDGGLTKANTAAQVVYPATNPRGAPSGEPRNAPEIVPAPVPANGK